jgi:radical SAM protein (TIGR01212 family)
MKEYTWGTKRRINAASNYLKNKFGFRIQKLTIDAGFTCPNRDGTKGEGGCAFCNNEAFNPSYCTPEKSIRQQIDEGIDFHAHRYRKAPKYLAYFQAFSNTYASVEYLKKVYPQALQNENMVGLIIGTRPDCIDEPKLEYLAQLSEKYYVVVEYGIETIYEKTLKDVNRGHTFKDSLHALEQTKQYGVKSGAHFIFGLPGETRKQMLDSADVISALPLHTVKFHQLQIVKSTRYAREFEKTPAKFNLFTLDEYVQFLCEFLSMLNPAFIIERLAAETQPWNNLTEMWGGLRYDQVLSRIEEKMEELDMWQGKYYQKNNSFVAGNSYSD